eukprot:2502192-Rhodomonas_salina.1
MTANHGGMEGSSVTQDGAGQECTQQQTERRGQGSEGERDSISKAGGDEGDEDEDEGDEQKREQEGGKGGKEVEKTEHGEEVLSPEEEGGKGGTGESDDGGREAGRTLAPALHGRAASFNGMASAFHGLDLTRSPSLKSLPPPLPLYYDRGHADPPPPLPPPPPPLLASSNPDPLLGPSDAVLRRLLHWCARLSPLSSLFSLFSLFSLSFSLLSLLFSLFSLFSLALALSSLSSLSSLFSLLSSLSLSPALSRSLALFSLLSCSRSLPRSLFLCPMRYPVLISAICLRACYAMSGTNIAYGATREMTHPLDEGGESPISLRTCPAAKSNPFARSPGTLCTENAAGTGALLVLFCGTDVAYGASRRSKTEREAEYLSWSVPMRLRTSVLDYLAVSWYNWRSSDLGESL